MEWEDRAADTCSTGDDPVLSSIHFSDLGSYAVAAKVYGERLLCLKTNSHGVDLRRRREKKTARFQDLDTWQAESRSRRGKLERMEASMSPSIEHSSSSSPFLFLSSIKCDF